MLTEAPYTASKKVFSGYAPSSRIHSFTRASEGSASSLTLSQPRLKLLDYHICIGVLIRSIMDLKT